MVAQQATQGQWNSKIRLSLVRSSVTAEGKNIISGRNLKQQKAQLSLSSHFANYIENNWFFPVHMDYLDTL